MFHSALLLAGFATCLMPAAAGAETIAYHATLSGAAAEQDRRHRNRHDDDLKMLGYTVQYTGLSGPAMAGHFHGPAGMGKNAAMLIPIMAPLASPINGMAKLSDAEIAAFRPATSTSISIPRNTRTVKSAARWNVGESEMRITNRRKRAKFTL